MTQHPNDLLEDYALHLLPATVEQSVAEHLAGCADCRQRVDSLERALGLLALAAPHALPPEDAEERLLQRVNALRRAEVSSLGPAVARRQQRQAAGPRELSHPPRWLSMASSPARGAATRSGERRRSRVMVGLLAVAAALALAVGLLGAQTASLRHRNAVLQAKASAQETALAIVAAPGALVRQLAPAQQAAKGAIGAMAMDPSSGRGVLLISSLPVLPKGKTYEFWIVQQQTSPSGETETVHPITTFTAASGEVARVAFSVQLPSSQIVNAGISIEPAGGVAHPDSPMIMLFAA